VTAHHERRAKREKNQQDATNLMFIIKLLSQHVSFIIMPIIRRTRPCSTAYGVLHCNKRVNWTLVSGRNATFGAQICVMLELNEEDYLDRSCEK